MHPEIISIGDFMVPTYGVLVALGFLAGIWIAARLAKQSGLDPDKVTNLGVYCALAGLVGAKILMVILDLGYYVRNPGELFSMATLRAGGVFYGGLILALVVAVAYLRKRELPALRTADALAPGIALGHSIGRLGCFAAGCCWGVECQRWWAVTFTNPEAQRLVGVPLNQPLHPTQLYESAAEAIIFGLLYRWHGRHGHDGAVIGLYLILYSIARFGIEFVRFHQQPNPFGGPLSAMQWVSLGLVGVGVLLLRKKKAGNSG